MSNVGIMQNQPLLFAAQSKFLTSTTTATPQKELYVYSKAM